MTYIIGTGLKNFVEGSRTQVVLQDDTAAREIVTSRLLNAPRNIRVRSYCHAAPCCQMVGTGRFHEYHS